MVKEFKIIINQPPNQAHNPGAEVSGTLVVEVDEPKNDYKNIQIALDGTGSVWWTETEGSGDERRIVTRSHTETYASETVIVWEAEHAPGGSLPPGVHNYPFRFVLPPEIPSSVEGTGGHIRYKVEGRIRLTGVLKEDKVIEEALQIAQVVDAANNPELQVSQQFESEKTVLCLCCASGPITTTAKVERTGFCIGGSVPFTVELENGSSRQVTLSATVEQTIRWLAHGEIRRINRKDIAEINSDAIEANTTMTWNPAAPLKIPETHTTLSASLVEVEYILHFKTQISGALPSNITVPVIIGNVPRRE